MKLARKHNVDAYPTIKAWVHGKEMDYKHGRLVSDFAEFVEQFTSRGVTTLESDTQLQTFKHDHMVFACGFFASATDPDAALYETIARHNRHNFIFTAVYSAEMAAAEGVTPPGLAVYKQFDEKKDVMEGGLHLDRMVEYLQAHSFPLLDHITPRNVPQYHARGLPIGWLFLDPTDEAAAEHAKDAARAAAATLRNQISFGWIDGRRQNVFMGRYGLTPDHLPAFALDDGDKFPFEGAHTAEALTAETLTAFAQRYLSKQLKPNVRSDADPRPRTVAGLTTAVGATFAEEVLDETKDVLVFYHSSEGCELCAEVRQVIELVAQRLEGRQGVRVVQIDVATNDPPRDYAYGALPTVKLVKASVGNTEVCCALVVFFLRVHGRRPLTLSTPPTQKYQVVEFDHHSHTVLYDWMLENANNLRK